MMKWMYKIWVLCLCVFGVSLAAHAHEGHEHEDASGVSPKIMAYAQPLGASGKLRVDANKYTMQEMPAEEASAFCTNVKTPLTSEFPYMVIFQHPGECVVFATEEEPSQETMQEMIKGIFTDINGKKWLVKPVKPVQVNFQMPEDQ